MFYQFVFKWLFVRFDPEFIHHAVVAGLRLAKVLGLSKLGALKAGQVTQVDAFGLRFDGAFGLAAGFDKNAIAVRALADLGFSHVEIGTVTALAQPGNPKPRLFRLTVDRALINRMGFNNQGAHAVANRLGVLRAKYGNNLPIIGVNIGKSKVTPVEQAASDYRTSAKLLAPFADYLAVNVSSPNTPGLRSLQSVQALRPILSAVIEESLGLPVLVKIAPDLADEDIVDVAGLVLELGLAGVIATNTTIARDAVQGMAHAEETGGLSGAPLCEKSNEVIRQLRAAMGPNFPIIGVGGILSGADAVAKIKAGADVVQIYTGLIYKGPALVKEAALAIRDQA